MPQAVISSPLTEPEATVVDYWAFVSHRRYEEAWEVLSWSFRERNFNQEIGGYLDELATIETVDVLSIRESTASPGFAEVEAELEFRSTTGAVQTQSMMFRLIYDSSTGSWHIDSARFD
jgi:hypothetical protein